MLRARSSTGLCILGLTEENIRRLKADKPILVSLAELGGTDDVLIYVGKDIEDLKTKFETITGARLPEPDDLNKLRNTQ